MNLKLPFLYIFLFITPLLTSGCVTVYNQATGRQESLIMGTPQEVNLGKQMNQELHQKMKFVADPGMLQRLRFIGTRVANYSDRQDLYYNFSIVQDKELNAFATPGGYVYINSGLMNAATDDELAGVIAHEVGHIAAKHSIKQMQGMLGMQMLLGIVGGMSSKTSLNQTLTIVSDLVNLGYSRQDELFADTLAIRYMKRSGFNPYGFISFFKKLEQNAQRTGRSAPPVFLSSHPPIAQRIAHAQQEINAM
jgi:predicted Zn-dependent protease